MKKIIFIFYAFLLVLSFSSCVFFDSNNKDNPASGRIPDPTREYSNGYVNDYKYVNDHADLFTQNEIEDLEIKIDNIYRKKDAQIVIVTTPDLGNYTISDYAQRVGDKWGIGSSSTDRGIVIIIKPKNRTRGEAYIATSYGLEEELSDVMCRKIVSDNMVPYFKQNNYYDAVQNALNYIALSLD